MKTMRLAGAHCQTAVAACVRSILQRHFSFSYWYYPLAIPLSGNNLKQVVHTYASGTKQYKLVPVERQ